MGERGRGGESCIGDDRASLRLMSLPLFVRRKRSQARTCSQRRGEGPSFFYPHTSSILLPLLWSSIWRFGECGEAGQPRKQARSDPRMVELRTTEEKGYKEGPFCPTVERPYSIVLLLCPPPPALIFLLRGGGGGGGLSSHVGRSNGPPKGKGGRGGL